MTGGGSGMTELFSLLLGMDDIVPENDNSSKNMRGPNMKVDDIKNLNKKS